MKLEVKNGNLILKKCWKYDKTLLKGFWFFQNRAACRI